MMEEHNVEKRKNIEQGKILEKGEKKTGEVLKTLLTKSIKNLKKN